jgi:hypothetical protein
LSRCSADWMEATGAARLKVKAPPPHRRRSL